MANFTVLCFKMSINEDSFLKRISVTGSIAKNISKKENNEEEHLADFKTRHSVPFITCARYKCENEQRANAE